MLEIGRCGGVYAGQRWNCENKKYAVATAFGWLGRDCSTFRLRRNGAAAAFAMLDQALRLDVLRLRLVVLRAAPRADAALRVVFRFFAPPFLFFDVIGMSNDSSCV